jgi:predicted dienelactone hydrolase
MRTLGLSLTLLVVACGPAHQVDADPLPFAPAGPGVTPDPSQPGPYPVGVRTVTYQDTGRRDANGTPRQLVTEIWYPATQATRGQPGTDYDLKPLFTAEQQAAIGNALPLLHTSAVRDAPVASTHGPFPVVFFSHGQAAVRWQSTYYTVLLASHGYVVISTDHQGGTLYDVVRGQLQNVAVGVETRPADVIYLMNAFERLPASDPLHGLLDFTKVGVTGHSFGALTTLRVAAMDPRPQVIVPQAPVDANVAWLALPTVSLTIPVLVEAAHDDQTLGWDDNVAPTWAALHRPRWLLDLTHGGHFTFSDLCSFDLGTIADQVKLDIPGANVKKVLSDGCGPNAPPASVAQPLITHFAVALFNGTLRGSEGSLALMTQAAADGLTPGVAQVTADP